MRRVLGARGGGLGKITLALAAALALVSCASKPEPSRASLFPNGNEAPGWVKTGETRTFEAGNLWEYIDGDAEKYVRAGVQKTLTTDYRYKEKIEATVDVHVMGTPEGAQKIFGSESSEGSQPLALGDAGRISKSTLTFRKGPYFVRLVAYQETPEVGEALTALARAMERTLPKSGAGD